MIRFLLLWICAFSGVQSQGLKTCASNDLCTPNPLENVNCHGDCTCRDSMVDECSRPHPTTAIHVNTITDCMNNCEVFALEGRCKFIIFHFDNIDENCLIMNDEFDKYLGHCNEIGQPLWGPERGQGIARWRGCEDELTCHNEGAQPKSTCNTCTDCSKKKECRGYILSHCTIFSNVLEKSFQTTFDHCEIWARTTAEGTYMHYDREQASCEVYGEKYNPNTGAGFERECTVAIVQHGTDPNDCVPDVVPTDSPTDAPPPDGCWNDLDCGHHPCGCSKGECKECQWCSKKNQTDSTEMGQCAPGCADDKDCKGPLKCSGWHECVGEGGTYLERIQIFTETCEKCAGTNEEVGAVMYMLGKNSKSCQTNNLDHSDRVDYKDGVNSEFKDKELGPCDLADLQGSEIEDFSLTWNGIGTWSPSKVELYITGIRDPVICDYEGVSFSDSETIHTKPPIKKCARDTMTTEPPIPTMEPRDPWVGL